MVEFALVVVFLVPLLLGTFSIGMSLTKTVQAGIVSRDAGAMFMRYVDFTLAANKAIIVRLANGMGMTVNGGNGVVILTQVMKVGVSECTSGGYPNGVGCPNLNRHVVVKRMTVGNTALYTTTYGNPNSGLISTDGTIPANHYVDEASCVASGFDSVMTLNTSESAFVSEAYFRTPEIDMIGYRTNTYVYQRSIF